MFLRKSSAIFCALLVASGIGFTSTSSEIWTWGITASAVSSFGGFEYVVENDNNVTITGYKLCGPTNLIIPSEIDGKTVTKIGSKAFLEDTESVAAWFGETLLLDTVELPDTIEEIGDYAFEGCTYLKSCKFGVNLKSIGKGAFSNCTMLSNVTLPDGLIRIKEGAFSDCYYALDSITLPDGVEEIEKNVFAGCDILSTVKFGTNVKYIGDGAFSGCLLRTLNIPDSVESIGDRAFAYCGISEISFGSGLKTIGVEAFSGISARVIDIPENVTSIGDGAFSRVELGGIDRDIYVHNSNIDFSKYGYDTEPLSFPFYCQEGITTIHGYSNSSLHSAILAFNYNNPEVKFVSMGEVLKKDIVHRSTINTNVISLGEHIIVYANADNVSDDAKYAVYYKKCSEKKWTVVQTYSKNKKIFIQPLFATDYDICIKVKDIDGRIAKGYYTVHVNYNFENTSIVNVGQLIKVHCSSIGGIGT